MIFKVFSVQCFIVSLGYCVTYCCDRDISSITDDLQESHSGNAMKLATWNINSVRLRIGLVARLLAEERPDVLALQETKTINDFFPREALAKLGYVHQA